MINDSVLLILEAAHSGRSTGFEAGLILSSWCWGVGRSGVLGKAVHMPLTSHFISSEKNGDNDKYLLDRTNVRN